MANQELILFEQIIDVMIKYEVDSTIKEKELKIFNDLMSLETGYDFDINIFSGFRFYETSFKFHDFIIFNI